MPTRYLAILLSLLFILLQYDLWIGEGSLSAAWTLEKAIELQQRQNTRLKDRNIALEAEVNDLKSGLDAIEERARSELGMIKEDETFFQVIEKE
jgi:cell division protein FtsB